MRTRGCRTAHGSGFLRAEALTAERVLNPDDAATAVTAGVAGIIVSNHGARNLDTVPATIDALPLVVEKVAGRVPVLVDGGIRRGTDIVKAPAPGASAVQIGARIYGDWGWPEPRAWPGWFRFCARNSRWRWR